MDWKNILSRAAWTFVQAFIATIPVAVVIGDAMNWDALTAGLIVAAQAGLAAVISLIKTVAQEQLAKLSA